MSGNKIGLAWSEDFELGCEEVDAQHRQLFILVTDLIKACTEGYDTEILQETLEFLIDYTVQHFNDEEAFMVRYEYPDYERHKGIHNGFKKTVRNFVVDFVENDSTTDLSNDVNRIVVRWLINHIQREDKKIGDYVRSLESA